MTLSPARFLAVFGFTALGTAALVVTLNAVVDPLGVVPFSPSVAGLNAHRVMRVKNDRVYKPLDLLSVRPRTVVMGTSRILQAFTPDALAGTPYAPAYNYGFPGGSINEIEMHFSRFVATTPSVRHVFIELFLPSPHRETRTPGLPELLATTFLSWSALQGSAETVWHNVRRRPASPLVLPDGSQSFVAMSVLPNFLTYPAYFERTHLRYFYDAPVIDAMKRMRDLASRRGIALTFFISPVHAVQLYPIHATGQWPVLEEWKRTLAREFDVRDFSAYTDVTEEPVSTNMRYWTDAVHFSSTTAGLIAERLAGRGRERGDPFGAPLALDRVEDDLKAWRSARDRWIAGNPAWVALFELARQGQETDMPPMSLVPGGVECPVRVADAVASRLTPAHASRAWVPVSSRTTLDPPIVIHVESAGASGDDMEATCELTIEAAPEHPSVRPVDWRIGHALGSPAGLRGRRIRYTLQARASVPTTLDTGVIYVYDGSRLTRTPIRMLTPTWHTAVVEHTVSADASRLEIWFRLVDSDGGIRPVGHRIAFNAVVEAVDDPR